MLLEEVIGLGIEGTVLGLLEVRLNGMDRCWVTKGFAEGNGEFIEGEIRYGIGLEGE